MQQTSPNGTDSRKRPGYGALLWSRFKEHPLARVGPGLITGVADDDPSGIATYSQAGAQFGLNMLWTMPLAFPLMAAMQSMCARIGRVTGKGLAANIKQAFPPVVVRSVVVLLLIANTLNIAADVAAMGEVAELVTGIDRHVMTLVFVLGTLVLQIFVPYHRYVRLSQMADAVAARLRRGAVHRARALGRGGAAHGLAAVHGSTPARPPSSSASSAPPSAPICSSGRPPRRSRTCSAARAPPPLKQDPGGCPQGTAAHPLGYLERHVLFEPHRLFHHPRHRRSRCTSRGSTTSTPRRRRPARCGRSPATSPTCCSPSAFSASA